LPNKKISKHIAVHDCFALTSSDRFFYIIHNTELQNELPSSSVDKSNQSYDAK